MAPGDTDEAATVVEDGGGHEATTAAQEATTAGRDGALGVLGVPRTASEAEIRRAYHRLAWANHPDRLSGSDDRERAAERFKEVSEAYEAITRPRPLRIPRVYTAPAPAHRSAAKRRLPSGLLLRAATVICIVGLISGYAFARSQGVDVDAARSQGAKAGAAAGARQGRIVNRRLGYRRGYHVGYRKGYTAGQSQVSTGPVVPATGANGDD